MTSRNKVKKRKTSTNKLTIDQLHKSKYEEIDNIENIREDYLGQISNYEKEVNLLKQNTLNPTGIPQMSIEVKIWDLEEKIEKLKKKIEDLKNKETDYLLYTSKVLKKYYKMVKEEEQVIKQLHDAEFNKSNKKKKKQTIITPNKALSIFDKLDAASSGKKQIDKAENTNSNSTENEPTHSRQNTNLTDSDNAKKSNNPNNFNKLYNTYMRKINPDYIKKYESTILNKCKSCKEDLILNYKTGLFNCVNCGMCKNVIIDTDKQNHKEPPKEMTSFSYRRINHLNEILSQIQGKETTDIPKEIYEEIYAELRKERFSDISKLTTDKLKKVLKKIGRSKYYEHIPYMVIQMGGIPPPVISPEVEEIIRDIFLKMQHPFNNCEKDRVNFLTYTGVLYKIFELLDMDHYLKNFKFLKDDKKQYYQEQIWKQICEELKWEFIPSS